MLPLIEAEDWPYGVDAFGFTKSGVALQSANELSGPGKPTLFSGAVSVGAAPEG
jgi:hypothetical protein